MRNHSIRVAKKHGTYTSLMPTYNVGSPTNKTNQSQFASPMEIEQDSYRR